MNVENFTADPGARLGTSSTAAALAAGGPPVKTAEGRAEIANRERGLTQRQRAVLLLVDGRRSAAQIRHLSQQIGAAAQCLDELVDLGLVTPALTGPIAPDAPFGPILPLASPEPAIDVEATLIPDEPNRPDIESSNLAARLGTIIPFAPRPTAGRVAAEPLPMPLLLRRPSADAQDAVIDVPAPRPLTVVPRLEVDGGPLVDARRAALAPAPIVARPTAFSWPTRDALPASGVLPDFAPTQFAPPPTPSIAVGGIPASASEAELDPESARRLSSDLFDEFVRAHHGAEPASTSASPSTRGGRLDSMMSSLYPLLETAFGALSRSGTAVEHTQDEGLEEARRVLLREMRAKAPVTGALTLVKLRRVATREDLLALLDEVATHISVPMRRLSAQQTLQRVRALLERPM